MSDRIFVNEKGKTYDRPGKGRVEYLRAGAIQEAITPKLWQHLVQRAKTTFGISAPAIEKARELVEGAG